MANQNDTEIRTDYNAKYNADLIAAYEEVMDVPAEQRLTSYFGDYGIHAFKIGVTDEQIEPIYQRSLAAMNMSSEEFNAQSNRFMYRSEIVKQMRDTAIIIEDDEVVGAASKENIKSVIIPDSVTSIGDEAFLWCRMLKSVTIPNSVTEISARAFENCLSLTNVTIPDSVTKIGKFAFGGCSALQSVTIPNGVAEVCFGAFLDCKSLQSVTIPGSVTEIGEKAFVDCESLQSITIPDSVTEIGASAFSGCKSFKSVTIPDSVNKIGNSVFAYCKNLESVTIGEGVTEIGAHAFAECKHLESVTIPNGVTEIGDYAFSGCDSLKSITIPDSVTKIGEEAFGIVANYNPYTEEEYHTPMRNIVVCCSKGSVAEEYAIKNNLKVETIEQEFVINPDEIPSKTMQRMRAEQLTDNQIKNIIEKADITPHHKQMLQTEFERTKPLAASAATLNKVR